MWKVWTHQPVSGMQGKEMLFDTSEMGVLACARHVHYLIASSDPLQTNVDQRQMVFQTV